MAGNVYGTYELAKEKAHERMKELEQDIFICHTKYPSGQEFTLKTKSEVGCGDYLYMLQLPFRFKFSSKETADREASNFASKKGAPVYVKRKTAIENGYKKTLYFYLTYKEPCLT